LIKNFNYYIKTKSKNEKKEEADRKEEKAEHNELTSDLSKILKPHDKERN